MVKLLICFIGGVFFGVLGTAVVAVGLAAGDRDRHMDDDGWM